MRCPIFTLAWTPEGRRLITGASSGEFTLWNGLTFNFETILQAHDSPVRAMKVRRQRGLTLRYFQWGTKLCQTSNYYIVQKLYFIINSGPTMTLGW